MLNGSPPQSNGPLNGWGRLLGLVGVPGAISLYLVWWLTQGWAPSSTASFSSWS